MGFKILHPHYSESVSTTERSSSISHQKQRQSKKDANHGEYHQLKDQEPLSAVPEQITDLKSWATAKTVYTHACWKIYAKKPHDAPMKYH